MTIHALTVDLEDWHQLVRRRVTGEYIPPTSSVVTATYHLLDVLEQAGVRATFFVVGYVAEVYPELVRDVAARGHEIGSHTHDHNVIRIMQPAAFRADVERSRKQLQDLTGQPVIGFRAPEFSVGSLDHWSFSVLADVGFLYDSSVFPVRRARYGIPDAPRTPFTIQTSNGTIHEFPLATWDVGRYRVPVAGGTYFRLWPSALLGRALTEIDRSGGTAVLYFHPYEFHTSLLYLSDLGWRQRMHPVHLKYALLHNLATGRIRRRLAPLLTKFEFKPLVDIYRTMGAGPSPTFSEREVLHQ